MRKATDAGPALSAFPMCSQLHVRVGFINLRPCEASKRFHAEPRSLAPLGMIPIHGMTPCSDVATLPYLISMASCDTKSRNLAFLRKPTPTAISIDSQATKHSHSGQSSLYGGDSCHTYMASRSCHIRGTNLFLTSRN